MAAGPTYAGQDINGTIVHGYVAGATVFADADHDGAYDVGEAYAITDALGRFFLDDAVGSLVSNGGVDTSTNQPITIRLEAPEGSTVITPLTTLVSLLLPANPTTADIAAAEATVLKGLGLSLQSGQSLLSLDPVAGTLSGDPGATDAYLAGAKVYDAISILGAGLSNQGGVSFDAASSSIAAALANQIEAAAASGQAFDLGDTANLTDVLTTAATALGETLDPAAVTSIANIAVASNDAMDEAVAGLTSGEAIFLASSAVQQVAEGATTSALQNLPAGQPVSSVEAQYTGDNLDKAVDAAEDSVSLPAPNTEAGTLLINLSGDQYLGNPEFQVYVDGKLVAGELSGIGGSGTSTETGISASHAQNQWQTFKVAGTFDTTVTHKVEISFNNDFYGGSQTNDRNLYVGNITLGGQAVKGTADDHPAELLANGTVQFDTPLPSSNPPPASGTDKLVIQLSGDQYLGNPDFLVYVDGTLVTGQLSAIGGSGTSSETGVSAIHTQNEWQAYTVTGNFDPSVAHKVEVVFNNDFFLGTATTDRNLYVGDVTLNGTRLAGASNAQPAELLRNNEGASFTSSVMAGGDTIPSGTGHSTLAGGESQLFVGSGGDTLYGGLSAGAHDTLTAGTGDNLLSVKYGANVLRANEGLDTLRGGSGHDTLYGGGSTALYAGSGGDTLYGGLSAGAHDTLASGAGNDLLSVTQGNNVLFGGAGFDTLQGGSGHDTLYGGGQSAMFAGSGGDTLYGGLGSSAHDTLTGGAGNDLLSVTQGNNSLYASGGMDTLYAGSGQDTLYAGSGDAKMYGSSGDTTFMVSGTTGNDTIIGGTGTSSVIIGGHSSTDAQYKDNGDGSTTITFGAGSSQSVTLSGIDTLHYSGDNTDYKIS